MSDNKPFDHPSTNELNNSNIYKDTADLTAKKDGYKDSQRRLEPKTYREENHTLYWFTSIYKLIFPIVSLSLIVILAYMLTQSEETVEKFGSIGIGLNWTMLVVVSSVFALVEIVKTRNLSKFFQSLALRWEIAKKTRYLAILASLVSILSSAIGGYLLTFQTIDKTDEIEGVFATNENQIFTNFEKSEISIKSEYEDLIKAKRETKDSYQPPKKYRSLRAKIDKEIEGLVADRDRKLAALEQKKEASLGELEAVLITDLTSSSTKATNLGLILFIIVVLLEGANTFSHYFYWQFHVKSVNEGVMFGGIEKPLKRSALEIQFAHFQQNFQRLGGYSNPTLPAPTQEDDHQIGFKQGYKGPNPPKNPAPETGIDTNQIKAIVIDILGSMSGDDRTKYLYKYFDKDDAKASRKKKENKADLARKEAKKLKQSGLTVAQIATEIGKSKRQVTRYLNS